MLRTRYLIAAALVCLPLASGAQVLPPGVVPPGTCQGKACGFIVDPKVCDGDGGANGLQDGQEAFEDCEDLIGSGGGGSFTPDADPSVDHSGYVAGHADGSNCGVGQAASGTDASGNAQTCIAVDADDVSDDNVESMQTVGGSGTAPVSNGASGLAMTDIATQAELDATAIQDLSGVNETGGTVTITDNTTFDYAFPGQVDIQTLLIGGVSPGSFGVGLLASRPATCTIRDQYFATDNESLYVCEATNTWASHTGLNNAIDIDLDGNADLILCGDYDADGTLETEDDVQGCIASVGSSTKPTVIVSAGAYTYDGASAKACAGSTTSCGLIEPIAGLSLICHGAHLQGAGESHTDAADEVSVIYLDPADTNVTIRGCEIDGGFSDSYSGSSMSTVGTRMAVLSDGPANLTIESNFIHDTSHTCAYIRDAQNMIIRGNIFDDCGGAGDTTDTFTQPAIYVFADNDDGALTISSADTGTERITTSTAHGLSTGDMVHATGTVPTGVVPGRHYIVTVIDADEVTLEDLYGNAVDITATGTGSLTPGGYTRNVSIVDNVITGSNIGINTRKDTAADVVSGILIANNTVKDMLVADGGYGRCLNMRGAWDTEVSGLLCSNTNGVTVGNTASAHWDTSASDVEAMRSISMSGVSLYNSQTTAFQVSGYIDGLHVGGMDIDRVEGAGITLNPENVKGFVLDGFKIRDTTSHGITQLSAMNTRDTGPVIRNGYISLAGVRTATTAHGYNQAAAIRFGVFENITVNSYVGKGLNLNNPVEDTIFSDIKLSFAGEGFVGYDTGANLAASCSSTNVSPKTAIVSDASGATDCSMGGAGSIDNICCCVSGTWTDCSTSLDKQAMRFGNAASDRNVIRGITAIDVLEDDAVLLNAGSTENLIDNIMCSDTLGLNGMEVDNCLDQASSSGNSIGTVFCSGVSGTCNQP